jgi:hypothetical protein
MTATLGERPLPRLPPESKSTFAKPSGKNTNYFNFDPSPYEKIQYDYEFLDGNFVVNLAGVNFTKSDILDTWKKF